MVITSVTNGMLGILRLQVRWVCFVTVLALWVRFPDTSFRAKFLSLFFVTYFLNSYSRIICNLTAKLTVKYVGN